MKKRKFLLSGLALFFFLAVSAQTKKISGRVTGPGNSGLAGVTVAVKGTTNATASSADGSFSIEVPTTGKPILVFTNIGYEPMELAVDEKNFVAATMSTSSKEM